MKTRSLIHVNSKPVNPFIADIFKHLLNVLKYVHNFYLYVNNWACYCPKEKSQEKVEGGNVREKNIIDGEKQLIRDKIIPLDLATGNNWKSEDLIKADKDVKHWNTVDDN